MRQRGFTLIEILVTVLLLAFLSAFIVPTYTLVLSQLVLTSAVAQVSDEIRQAEQQTVTQQQIYGVTFVQNATNVPLFLYDPNSQSDTVQSTLNLPGNIVISQVNFSGNTDVRFTTSGSPNVSGTVVLKDTARNRQRTIEIRPSGNILANTPEF